MQSHYRFKKGASLFTLSFLLVFLSATKAQQLYKQDNKAYKAVYLNEAARIMKENKDYILLDVRTPSEYADTSSFKSLNLGHLKGARNINIDSFEQHIPELKQYADKKILLYCSHSQRSRRVGKILSDNGFTNVYNINGGMSIINESSTKEFPDKYKFLETATGYKNISGEDALEIIQKPGSLVIDVRSAEIYNSADTNFIYNIGHIKNAVNIPAAVFNDKFSAMQVPKDKPILLYEGRGNVSAAIAESLVKQGYTHVNNIFEGLSVFMADNNLSAAQVNAVVTAPPPFKIIGAKECVNIFSKYHNLLVIDARPEAEFNNKASMEFLNVGRIKNAVNVSAVSALAQIVAKVDKNAPILLYGSTSSNIDADVCESLVKMGYKNIYYLYRGIGNLAWSSFNVESCKDGINILTNHEGLY